MLLLGLCVFSGFGFGAYFAVEFFVVWVGGGCPIILPFLLVDL